MLSGALPETRMSDVLALPPELLLLLVSFLRDIEDFLSLSSTCRRVRDSLKATRPNQILRLAAAADRTFFTPVPHFLVAATARQVAEWALQSPENTQTLRQAFKAGMESLFNLCLRVAGLTLADLQRLHEIRFSVINPVTDLINRITAIQSTEYGDFSDERSDAASIECEPERSLFQIVIYGELFASTFESHLLPAQSLPRFDVHTRLDFIRYCIPDWYFERLPGNKYLPPLDQTGPYGPEVYDLLPADAEAIDHILCREQWLCAWEDARLQAGPDFDEMWKQTMWENVVQCQGIEGLEMIADVNKAQNKLNEGKDRGTVKLSEKWVERLKKIHEQIKALSEDREPARVTFGTAEYPVSDCPDMGAEIILCLMR